MRCWLLFITLLALLAAPGTAQTRSTLTISVDIVQPPAVLTAAPAGGWVAEGPLARSVTVEVLGDTGEELRATDGGRRDGGDELRATDGGRRAAGDELRATDGGRREAGGGATAGEGDGVGVVRVVRVVRVVVVYP